MRRNELKQCHVCRRRHPFPTSVSLIQRWHVWFVEIIKPSGQSIRLFRIAALLQDFPATYARCERDIWGIVIG